jgi:hypothetical protein
MRASSRAGGFAIGLVFSALGCSATETPYAGVDDGGTPSSSLPVGAECTSDDQCSGPDAACLTGAYPLSGDPPPCAPAITKLGANFPGGYCTRKSACHSDSDCGTGGKCFIPLGDTPAATVKELADGVTCPSINKFGTDGFCLKPCTKVGDCDRDGYICDVPFGALISGIKGSRIDQKFCIGDP